MRIGSTGPIINDTQFGQQPAGYVDSHGTPVTVHVAMGTDTPLACLSGKPVLLYDLKCSGSQAYVRLASEIIQRERALRAA